MLPAAVCLTFAVDRAVVGEEIPSGNMRVNLKGMKRPRNIDVRTLAYQSARDTIGPLSICVEMAVFVLVDETGCPEVEVTVG